MAAFPRRELKPNELGEPTLAGAETSPFRALEIHFGLPNNGIVYELFYGPEKGKRGLNKVIRRFEKYLETATA